MKAGLTTSVIMHAAVLGFGLVSLSAPRAFEVTNVELFPVDIVPIEDVPQSLQGDKKSPMNEKPAPLPTQRPDIVADAQKVGENSVDTEKTPTPEPKPVPVETAAVPPPAPKPEPKPVKEPEPEPVKQAEPTPPVVPATEVTPKPQPKEEVKPDPVKEAIAAEPQPVAEAEAVKLPDQAPAPQAKPQPPQAQTAKAPDRKDTEKPTKETTASTKSDEKQFNADEVAALLNKQKPSGGGAKRSTEQASLGGKTKTGVKLSQSETAALSGQLANCWSIPAGLADGGGLRVSIRFSLDGAGKLDGRPSVATSSGDRTFDESAVRAVQKCDRDGLQVPRDKAEVWAEGVIVNFDPSEMF